MDRRVEDHPGETHAADRRPEQLRVVRPADVGDTAVGELHSHAHDVVPERSSTWWPLPWMSLAIAPPIVTDLVPGVTGTKKPRRTMIRNSSSSVAPPLTVTVRAVVSR
jgi:hypothetical protein